MCYKSAGSDGYQVRSYTPSPVNNVAIVCPCNLWAQIGRGREEMKGRSAYGALFVPPPKEAKGRQDESVLLSSLGGMH